METKDFAMGFAAGKAQGSGGGDEPTGTIEITTKSQNFLMGISGIIRHKYHIYRTLNADLKCFP